MEIRYPASSRRLKLIFSTERQVNPVSAVCPKAVRQAGRFSRIEFHIANRVSLQKASDDIACSPSIPSKRQSETP